MSVKRSRIGRSSSSGDTGWLNQPSSVFDSPDRRLNVRTDPPTAGLSGLSSAKTEEKPETEKEQSLPRILTLSSPVQDKEKQSVGESTEGFLEKCFYCKKKIDGRHDVFMYGYLRAFCSSKCRDEQIFMDKEMQKISEGLPGSLNGRGKTEKMEKMFDY